MWVLVTAMLPIFLFCCYFCQDHMHLWPSYLCWFRLAHAPITWCGVAFPSQDTWLLLWYAFHVSLKLCQCEANHLYLWYDFQKFESEHLKELKSLSLPLSEEKHRKVIPRRSKWEELCGWWPASPPDGSFPRTQCPACLSAAFPCTHSLQSFWSGMAKARSVCHWSTFLKRVLCSGPSYVGAVTETVRNRTDAKAGTSQVQSLLCTHISND